MKVRGLVSTSHIIVPLPKRLLVLALVASACGGPDADPAARPTDVWSVDSIPAVVIAEDAAAGSDGLEYARSATMLPNGNVVVVDLYAGSLRFYDPEGDPIRSAGRPGKGPGEFSGPRWIGQCRPDSLFVWDYSLRTITVLDTAGNYRRHFRPKFSPHEVSCASNGVLAVLDIAHVMTPLTQVPPTPAITKAWIANAVGDSIGWIGELQFGIVQPLGTIAHIASGGDTVYVLSAERPEILKYDVGGRPLGAFPIATTRRTPTPAHLDRAHEIGLADVTHPQVREATIRILEDLETPDALPPYHGLVVDAEGLLWLTMSIPGDARTSLRVYDGDGTVVASLSLPGDVTVQEVGSDYILGLRDDEDGRDVVVYRLRRD